MKVAEPLVLVQLAKLLNNLTNQSKLKTHPLKGEFLLYRYDIIILLGWCCYEKTIAPFIISGSITHGV